MERNQKLNLNDWIDYICAEHSFSKWWINEDPIKIANILNNFFSTIAAKAKSNRKVSKKNYFSNFLTTKNLDSFLYLWNK